MNTRIAQFKGSLRTENIHSRRSLVEIGAPTM